MSFLKELKEDLGQAMNELVSDEAVDTVEGKVEGKEENITVDTISEEKEQLADGTEVNTLDLDAISELLGSETENDEESEAENIVEESEKAEMNNKIEEEEIKDIEEEEYLEDFNNESDETPTEADEVESDEVTEITKGTVIEGNITSNGSLNIYGKVKGNVSCKGKLMIAGVVVGLSSAKEVFANNARIDGDIKSEGTIKVANGTIIIGNVYANSAVVAGAIKGDIDVHGPVIVDGTAVVQGNIKSRSVQINNGAAIEGFCSQCYADIDYKSLFDETFGK